MKLDQTELAKERRKQRRLEALGHHDPHCGTCGMDDWRCLEAHHVADHDRDGTTVFLCRNCHRKRSDDQKDHPAFDPTNDPVLDAIGHFLLGLADMLRDIIDRLRSFGLTLIERAQLGGVS